MNINFNIDIDNNEDKVNEEFTLSKSVCKNITQKKAIHLSKYCVDLGLPSGALWDKYNNGVLDYLDKLDNKDNWLGYDFYADSSELMYYPCEDYYESYKYFYLGNSPTIQQLEELLKCTTATYEENYNNVNGLKGILLTSKSNGKSIFFPLYADSVSVGMNLSGTRYNANYDLYIGVIANVPYNMKITFVSHDTRFKELSIANAESCDHYCCIRACYKQNTFS